MAVGDDGIQLDLDKAGTDMDQVVAAGAQWDALWAPVAGHVNELLSSSGWATDEAGQDFRRTISAALADFTKSGASIGPAFHKTGTDGRTALTQSLPQVDQQGKKQLEQL